MDKPKRTARLALTVMVDYDPDVTTSDAVMSSVRALVENVDIFWENGCGVVKTHITSASKQRGWIERPAKWDQQVTDLRVELLAQIKSHGATYLNEDEIEDDILGVPDDSIWHLIEDLNIGYELDGEWFLSVGERIILARALADRYLESEEQ